MQMFRFALLMAILCMSSACSLKRVKPVCLKNTEVHSLGSKQSLVKYKLSISLPEGYANSQESYPVLYLLDPDDSFAMAYDIQRDLSTFLGSRKIIIVGIGYESQNDKHDAPKEFWRHFAENRTRDYLPFPIIDDILKFDSHPGAFKGLASYAGHAFDFLQFIEHDLMPFIDKNYRVNGDNTLYGQSQGGLFASWVLTKYPDVFNRYLILSPTLWIENGKLLKDVKLIKKPVSATVYLAVGAKEESADFPMLSNAREFYDALPKDASFQGKLEILPRGKPHNGYSSWPFARIALSFSEQTGKTGG